MERQLVGITQAEGEGDAARAEGTQWNENLVRRADTLEAILKGSTAVLGQGPWKSLGGCV